MVLGTWYKITRYNYAGILDKSAQVRSFKHTSEEQLLNRLSTVPDHFWCKNPGKQ